MAEARSGRIEVYEVYDRDRAEAKPILTESGVILNYPLPVYVGTFWERAEAVRFYTALTGCRPRPEASEHTFIGRGGSGQRKVEVVVAGDEAFYDVSKEAIPVALIYDTAASAAHDFVATNPERAIPQQLQELAATAMVGATMLRRAD